MHMLVYGVELETQVSLERAISTGDMCRGALSRMTMNRVTVKLRQSGSALRRRGGHHFARDRRLRSLKAHRAIRKTIGANDPVAHRRGPGRAGPCWTANVLGSTATGLGGERWLPSLSRDCVCG